VSLSSSPVGSARTALLLRWLGLTLVVLMLLQLAALLFSWNWSLEPFRQLFVDRLVGEAPMALIGLLLVLVAQRLQPAEGRTPLRWLSGVLAVLLTIAMVAAVPLSISAENALVEQAQQQDAAIGQQTMQLEMQKKQVNDPAFVDQLIAEAEKEGRIPADATAEQKQQKAREFIDAQIRRSCSRRSSSWPRPASAATWRCSSAASAAPAVLWCWRSPSRCWLWWPWPERARPAGRLAKLPEVAVGRISGFCLGSIQSQT